MVLTWFPSDERVVNVEAIFLSWAGSAVVIVLLAVFLGYRASVSTGPLGILIDGRGRFSLTYLQLVAWTIVILSLICGICLGVMPKDVVNA